MLYIKVAQVYETVKRVVWEGSWDWFRKCLFAEKNDKLKKLYECDWIMVWFIMLVRYLFLFCIGAKIIVPHTPILTLITPCIRAKPKGKLIKLKQKQKLKHLFAFLLSLSLSLFFCFFFSSNPHSSNEYYKLSSLLSYLFPSIN